MGFFSMFETPVGFAKQGLDELGNQPQYGNPSGFLMGGAGTYAERAAARNAELEAEFQRRKDAEAKAQHAALQKQANPLDPSLVQGLAPKDVNQPEVNPYEHMQRRIYG